MNLLKQLFCKHKFLNLDEFYLGKWKYKLCNKCGKVRTIKEMNLLKQLLCEHQWASDAWTMVSNKKLFGNPVYCRKCGKEIKVK